MSIAFKWPSAQLNRRSSSFSGEIYLQPKVLASAVRSPDNPWRLRVALDRRGVIPRQSLHMITPQGGGPATLEALAAVLGSSIAAVWIDSRNLSRSIRLGVLRELPVPSDSDVDAWQALDEVGIDCAEAMRERGQVPRKLLRRLERTVSDAYRLSSRTRQAIHGHLAGFKGPEGAVRFAAVEDASYRPATVDDDRPAQRHFGSVLSVAGGRIRLWAAGLTPPDGIDIEPPPRFLGRAVAEGATFEVIARPGDPPSVWRFEFQPHSYERDEELVRIVLDAG